MCSMVKGIESLAEEVFSSALSGGSLSKVKSFDWCFCDEVICWYPGFAMEGLGQSVSFCKNATPVDKLRNHPMTLQSRQGRGEQQEGMRQQIPI